MDDLDPKNVGPLVHAGAALIPELERAKARLERLGNDEKASRDSVRKAENYVNNLEGVITAIEQGRPTPVIEYLQSRIKMARDEITLFSKIPLPSPDQQRRLAQLGLTVKVYSRIVGDIQTAIRKVKN